LTFGFGTSSGNETSPGPTITLKQGQTVTINFHNEGAMPHNGAVVTAKTDGNTNLAFSGAQVASANSPIAAGGTGSCAFTVDKTGTFYYICQVDAHVSLGMWGEVRVTE
jgi:plastocyanin